MFDIITSAFLTGLFVKLVDLIEDDGLNVSKQLSIIFGLLYASFIAYVITISAEVAPLWLAVLLGVILSGKIDAKSHYYAIGFSLFLIFLLGVPEFNTLYFMIFIIVSILDEILSSLVDKRIIKNKLLGDLLLLRPLLEIAAFTIAYLTGVWIIWFAVLSFDIAYIATNKLSLKFLR
jgi:ABC-type arginine transport system permease subunit